MNKIIIILVSQLFSIAFADNFNVGFNQAWMKTNFGSQWTNPQFDKKEAIRMLDLASKSGAQTLRVWLFEGVSSTALQWKDGKVAGLHPDFLPNFEFMLKEAKKRGIKLYPTLFTPEPLRDIKDQNLNNQWWNLYNNKFGGLEVFQKNALSPLLNLMKKDEYKDSIFGIDVANEIDSGVLFNRFENKWDGVNKFICSLKKDINPIPVTASVGWGKNPLKLYEGAENTIVKPNPSAECVDFWDLHVYRDSGEIKNCDEIKKLIKKYGKKIYLGEFGQDSKRFDDELQKQNAISFIKNAKNCGFSGALAWRLSDVRPGHNTEARHSYEAFEKDKMRPAYEVIKNNNFQFTKCVSSLKNCELDPNENLKLNDDRNIFDGNQATKKHNTDRKEVEINTVDK